MIKRYQKLRLIHQISLVILLGFGVSFFLSLYLLSADKSRSLNFLSSSGAIQRVISVVEIMRQTPEQLHPSILRASSSSDLMLSVSDQPQVSGNAEVSDREAVLINHLQRAGLENMHLSIVSHSRPILDMSNVRNMNEMHRAMMSGLTMQEMRARQMGYVATVDGSVQLSNGNWLNFSSGVQEKITDWSAGLLLSLFSVVSFTILLSLLIIHRALKPVRELGKAAQNFALNRKGSPVSTDCPSDLLPTINSFNEMQTRLADYIAERSKLLAAISHDLRTPLTSLRLRLEFIEDGEDKQKMLKTVSTMEKMLQATMSFAKENTSPEERQFTDIHNLLQTIVDEYADKGIIINYQQEQHLIEQIPALSIRRMVENLINNAIQYAGDNSTISVQAIKHKGFLKVVVADTGVGIESDKLKEVIKPFTRLDSSRDTGSSNVGLGLSITNSLANTFGGTLILEENLPHGLVCTFTIQLVS